MSRQTRMGTPLGYTTVQLPREVQPDNHDKLIDLLDVLDYTGKFIFVCLPMDPEYSDGYGVFSEVWGIHQGRSEGREVREHMFGAQLHLGGPALTIGGLWTAL
ncbi:unnamed protein product [Prorocentrum cordatum]|uniref:Uncharacterized protein n=1 Tax=Prorocentrum cordatum TaxID=2364126 RepID=A0ABN9U0B2_9DINO|nr:unnamed protein product [Polarella glacialis]